MFDIEYGVNTFISGIGFAGMIIIPFFFLLLIIDHIQYKLYQRSRQRRLRTPRL